MEDASGLKRPDLILLPHTGQVMKDLAWMHRTGMAEAVLRARRRGSIVFGIGGGYLMLGELVSDPRGVEEGGSIRGLGLLLEDVILSADRTRRHVRGSFNKLEGALGELSYLPLEGEEFHLGIGMVKNVMQAATLLRDEEGNLEKCEGAQGEDVYGTCVDGIFDGEEAARALLKALEHDQ